MCAKPLRYQAVVEKSAFLKYPSLPEGKVSALAIGETYEETALELQSMGIKALPVKRNNKLSDEITSHADMLLLHLGENAFAVDSTQNELISFLENNNARIYLEKGIEAPYPRDIALNKLILGNKIFGLFEKNKDFADNEYINKFEIFNTKQGYTKCSVCLVTENAVITDDKGIASLLKISQIEVLLIQKGDIFLSEAHYGFIGGACFKISKNKLYFNGNLEAHRDYKRITEFLKKHNIEPVFNPKRKLTDIGGAVQLFEVR